LNAPQLSVTLILTMRIKERMNSRITLLLLLAAPLLAGCLERGEPLPLSSVKTEDDDMYCRAGGKNAPGSPDYVYCRRDRDAQRNAAVVRANKKQQDLGDYMLNHPSDAGRQQ
jgi:hypothetical protein